jgi:hypothetical protein
MCIKKTLEMIIQKFTLTYLKHKIVNGASNTRTFGLKTRWYCTQTLWCLNGCQKFELILIDFQFICNDQCTPWINVDTSPLYPKTEFRFRNSRWQMCFVFLHSFGYVDRRSKKLLSLNSQCFLQWMYNSRLYNENIIKTRRWG